MSLCGSGSRDCRKRHAIGKDLLRAQWQRTAEQGSGDFERFWHDALRLGLVENSAAAPVAATPKTDLAISLPAPKETGAGISLLFRADEALTDGRHADNAWLLELPAACVS